MNECINCGNPIEYCTCEDIDDDNYTETYN